MQVPCRRAIGWPSSSSRAVERYLHLPLRAGAEIASQGLCNVLPAGETGLVKAVEIELKAFRLHQIEAGIGQLDVADSYLRQTFAVQPGRVRTASRYRRRETADYRHAGPAGRGLNCAARPAAARRHRYRGNRLIYRASGRPAPAYYRKKTCFTIVKRVHYCSSVSCLT